MLKECPAFSGFSTQNLDETHKFYSEILGLEVKIHEMGFMEVQLKGSAPVMIYAKDNHEPATFTVLNFTVEDIDKMVDNLRAKGVKMEHYEGFEQDEKGIARGEGPSIAWFKDPGGNVLALMEDY